MGWLKALLELVPLLSGFSTDRKNLVMVLLVAVILGTIGVQFVNSKHAEAIVAIHRVRTDTLHEVSEHEVRYAEALRELKTSVDRVADQQARQWELLVEINGGVKGRK